MITTSAQTASMVHALTERARTKALDRGEAIARKLSREPLNWRSANSLWPDLAQD